MQVKSAIQIAETFYSEWYQWVSSQPTIEQQRTEGIVISEVHLAYNAGGKIPAIKKLREHIGCGLKEAKDQVEAWAKEKGWVEPINRNLTYDTGSTGRR